MKNQISEILYKEAIRFLPGGVNSPVRAFGSVGRTPVFIEKAKGSKIYDADGNEYIDYVCSWGPAILGHAQEAVIAEVNKAVRDGLTFGAPTKKEVILAELISQIMPSMEMVRLVSSGTEAVMSAIRTARGFTKKDMIIKFRGCYHGHSDGLLVKAGSGALTQAVPDSAGVPKSYTENTLIAEYNDKSSVQQLFEEYKGKIAAVIVEPVAANMGVVLPEEDFLPFLRNITNENGSLLIFDEVITGFRLGIGGAQEYYKIKPDLTTLGKIVGGGMPIGAYGGRKDIMQMVSPLGPVYQAGTLSGNPVATAAGIKTLEILYENPGLYTEMQLKAIQLADAFAERSKDKKEPIQVNQIGSLICAFFTDYKVKDYNSAVTSDTVKYADYFGKMMDKGIYIAPSQFEAMFVSAAHTEEDIRRTCQVIKDI
ncbi:glutamate-1-semialdehyde 2,1-aminomutase [Anaerocolumna sedimenticola]|uniref:Glutamate-1-semialdehyde 2,1-aminomutase n=1 Tax=Anaerocolumna sedimenticola TaxID=2696063 RepID=A0A6P1TRQ5_9FIRM|nr:glutamate-1-semialdehyde 2,1-aminomutase [Anaerocolumna sedimenticola]QHQ62436.1 glutamate-1-semialdehyde 2,1-aminomutase [Anaerocolumna sedimenticola]